MWKLISCLMLAALVAVPLTALAEDEAAPAAEKEAPAAKRTVDPAAMKLIKLAQEKLFSNRDAGLRDFTCTVTMKNPMVPGGITCAVSFEVPDKSEVTVTKLPADMEPMRAMIEPQIKPQIEKMFIDFYKDEIFTDLDKYSIAMKEGSKDTIILTAFAKDAAAKKREIVFGTDGLPKQIHETGSQGDANAKIKYKEVEGKFLTDVVAVQTPNGPVSMKFEYEKSGKFWLVTRQVMTVEARGFEITILATDYKVNTKAVTPAEKPTQKPEGDD